MVQMRHLCGGVSLVWTFGQASSTEEFAMNAQVPFAFTYPRLRKINSCESHVYGKRALILRSAVVPRQGCLYIHLRQ